MVTTCPHCSTSFNVDPQVLLSRNGRVRCGRCKQIFDGLLAATTLEEFQAAAGMAVAGAADTPEPHWPALPEAPDVPIPPMPLEIAAAASATYLAESTPAALPAEAPNSSASSPLPPAASMAYTEDRIDARRDWQGGGKDSGQDGDAASDDSEGIDFASQESPRTRWPWVVAVTLAALLLAGQAAYRYRSELAAHYPATKPALAQACAWMGCSVPALQQPASLNIEASDLQVVDKSRPHLVQLTATLRNRATFDVGYPAFDLVLTDNRDHTLARRVIVPADYLAGNQTGAPVLAAIAANAEITVRVDMDITGLPAAGFRLNLAPAPVQ